MNRPLASTVSDLVSTTRARDASKPTLSWGSIIPIVVVHVLAFALAPWYFSWTGFAVGVASAYVIAPLGINLGYHRLLTHRSLVVPKWLEHTLVGIALLSLEGPPIQWVAVHRLHHRWSDTDQDPHSPIRSFLWGHMGWLFVNWRHQLAATTYARDVSRDAFYRWLQVGLRWFAIYVAHVVLFWAAAVLGGWLISHDMTSALHTGASVVVWGVLVRQVYVWHVTWSINSATHRWGYRTYETDDGSRNNWLLGLLGAGEGWHNNHHHDQASASNWHRPWELDYTYVLIRLLEALGLAHDVKRPRHRRRPAA
jgi:fatty-acid desaturase